MNCCRNKRHYTSEAEAEKAAMRARRKTGEPIHHYACPFSGRRTHWHCGHPVGWRRAQRLREKLNSC